jgi:hypothetical protein
MVMGSIDKSSYFAIGISSLLNEVSLPESAAAQSN